MAWFARLHNVQLEGLLIELNNAARREPSTTQEELPPSPADSIFKPFFLTGIATVLTLGCVWGAVNLLLIGLKQHFGGVDYSWVLAHGHAMVFGFVGFFIMGFAYQAFPRFKHTTLWRPGLAVATLPLMAVGIAVQTSAHLLAPGSPALLLALLAGGVQALAVVLFALIITKTNRDSGMREPHDRFVTTALGWFVLAALLNPVIFVLFELPPSREAFLFNVATFNIPFRDVELLGIAVLLIVGVSPRYIPHAYDLSQPSAHWQSFIFWSVNGALVVSSLAHIGAMVTGRYAIATVQTLASLILLVVAAGTPRQYRLFGPVPENERDRGLKFIRAAYAWFILAMLMLVLVPAYNFGLYHPHTATSVPFSHAFFGAYRHALTVGFITMMIVGVSAKVVPTLSGVDVRQAPSLWPTFLLLNLGNALRVTTQIATDFAPGIFFLVGVSGFIEVIALILWAIELVRNMRGLPGVDWDSSLDIAPQTRVGELLDRYPDALQVLLRHGFTLLKNPVLRRTVTRAITLEQAARHEGVVLESLIDDLQRAVSHRDSSKTVDTPAVASQTD